jgi:hypothetical protein
MPPAPVDRPVFADPSQPVPPLAALVPAPPESRDPQQPFDVASSVMTADSSAWASAHWAPPQPEPAGPQTPITTTPNPRPGLQPAPYGAFGPPPTALTNQPGSPATSQPASPPTNGHRPTPSPGPPPVAPHGAPSYPPPTTAPVYPAPYPYPPAPTASPSPTPYPPNPTGAPGQPFPAPSYPPPEGGPFPAPGTPQWFAPGSYQAPPPPAQPTARSVIAAATPGVLVTLVVGGFIWVLAPVTIIVAFLLTTRTTYGRRPTRTAFAAVLSFLGLVGLLSLVTADGVFADWWDTVAGWACFGSWVALVATLIAVYRAVKLGRPDPPPAPRVSLR